MPYRFWFTSLNLSLIDGLLLKPVYPENAAPAANQKVSR